MKPKRPILHLPKKPKFTVEKLNELCAFARKNAIRPKTIKSNAEARRMSANHPFDKEWKRGDEYFELHTVDGVFNVF